MRAGGGGRTRTPSLATDFESASSANSNTPAYAEVKTQRAYYTMTQAQMQAKDAFALTRWAVYSPSARFLGGLFRYSRRSLKHTAVAGTQIRIPPTPKNAWPAITAIITSMPGRPMFEPTTRG